MPDRTDDRIDDVRWILDLIVGGTAAIAVVGLSPNPERPSYGVAKRLKDGGCKIVPVNPGATEVLGEPCYRSLEDVPGAVDVVQIFRHAEDVPPIVDAAVKRGAKAIWMQTGISNEAAAERARVAGLRVVMDRCLATDFVLYGRTRS